MTFVDAHQPAFADHGFCARAACDPEFDRRYVEARGLTGDARDQMILGRAQRLDLETPRAVFGFQRPVIRDCQRVGCERPQPDLAANAVCGPDTGDADAGGHWARAFLSPHPNRSAR